jgi:hypothetical protein
MANNKNYIVFYNESKEIVGYREHHFDWEEGDTITTNGVKTTIFAIFRGTEKNLRAASDMIKTINQYMPKYKQVSILNEGVRLTGDVFDDMINVMMNSHLETIQTRKRVWKNFDAMLDFVEHVVNEVMD